MEVQLDKRSPWQGYAIHPVIPIIDRELQALGYKLTKFGPSYDWDFRWERAAFDRESYFVYIYFNKCVGIEVDISVIVDISSWEFSDMENKLKVWECLDGPQFGVSGGLNYASDVVRVPLHAFLLDAEPGVRRYSWRANQVEFEENALVLIQDLLRYGEPFLKKLSSKEALVNFLQNIQSQKGATSVNASLSAAIFLFGLGLKNAALSELRSGYEKKISSARSSYTRSSPEGIRALECKYERYKNFFSENM